jgi:hypothetical protein
MASRSLLAIRELCSTTFVDVRCVEDDRPIVVDINQSGDGTHARTSTRLSVSEAVTLRNAIDFAIAKASRVMLHDDTPHGPLWDTGDDEP